MRFAKYHGIGNDFIMVADLDDAWAAHLDAAAVRALCDRRFGVGADGVIRVARSREDGDLFMDYVNSDGSIGEMCGNGIRCLAIFAREEGLTTKSELRVDTRAGVKTVTIQDGGRVRVDMGPPIFAPSQIPVEWSGPDALHAKIELDELVLEATCLSMGNPHAVIFTENPPEDPKPLGSVIEKHPMFPNATNVELAHVQSPDRIEMRVWERGSGETLACGTGACAVMVAGKLVAGAEDLVTVSLPGGELEVEWTGSSSSVAPVYLTGPAQLSFVGQVDLDELMGAAR
jgi:diaminopimelate epimerase